MAATRRRRFEPLRLAGAVSAENINRIQDALRATSEAAADSIDLLDLVKLESVATVADLRSRSVKAGDGRAVLVRDYAIEGDGGGGLFVYRSSLSDTDDGGIVIKGWKRVFDGAIDPRWFGARPGVASHDSGPALEAAARVADYSEIVLPPGDYYVNSRRHIGATTQVKWVFRRGARIYPTVSFDPTTGPTFSGDLVATPLQEIIANEAPYSIKLGTGTSGMNAPPAPLHPGWFGAVGNNSSASAARNTLAFQRTFDQGSQAGGTTPNGLGARPLFVLVAAGNYYINSTVNYNGVLSPITFRGAMHPGGSGSTTMIKWNGSDGGTMFRFKGLYASEIARFLIDCSSREVIDTNKTMGGMYYSEVLSGFSTGAKYALHIDIQSSMTKIRECSFINGMTRKADNSDYLLGKTDACFIAIGDVAGSGQQADDLVLEDLTGGTCAAFLRFIDGLNCLNVTARRLQLGIGLCIVGLDTRNNEGITLVEGGGTVWGGMWKYCIWPGKKTRVVDLRVEADRFGGDNGCMLIGTNTSAYTLRGNYCEVTGCDVFLDAPASGPYANVGIHYEGKLVLRGNTFINRNQFGAPEFRVLANGASADASGLSASVISENNTYSGASTMTHAPIYDGSLNHLLGGDANNFSRLQSVAPIGRNVRSWGDNACNQIGNTHNLRPVDGALSACLALEAKYPAAPPDNYSQAFTGQTRVGDGPLILDYRWFKTSGGVGVAALSLDIPVMTLMQGERIIGAFIRHRTNYAGTAGTLTMRIGTTVGGNDLILDHLVHTGSTPRSIGNALADLGAGLNPVRPNGYCPSETATTQVWIRLTSSAGNLSALTAGASELHISRRMVPA